MTFLKRLGLLLAKGAEVAASVYLGIQPLLGSKASAVIGKGVNDFTQITAAVNTIELALEGKPGIEKLQALIPLVSYIVRTSETVSGHQIADEALFTKGIGEIAQGAVDVTNSLSDKGVSA